MSGSVKKYIGFRGFTIAELLIVISVIGILVAIVAVLYPGYQQRVRNSERKTDTQQVAAALQAYALKMNSFIETDSGCGAEGDGNGWLNAGPEDLAAYPKSVVKCLQEAGVLSNEGDFIDPSGCEADQGLSKTGASCHGKPVQSYMKQTCLKNSAKVTYILAYIEGDPAKDSEVDALCDPGTVAGGFSSDTQKWGTLYGMNYYVKVQ